MSRRPKHRRTLKHKSPNDFELPKDDNMEDVHLFMVGAWFLCNLYILLSFNDLDLSVFGLFKLSILSIGISFLIPIYFYRKKYTMSFYEYIILNILAAGPIICALILFVNITFSGPSYTETYKIVDQYRENGDVVYVLEDSQYEDKQYLRIVKNNENYLHAGKDFLKIRFSDGLLGIRIIEGKSLH